MLYCDVNEVALYLWLWKMQRRTLRFTSGMVLTTIGQGFWVVLCPGRPDMDWTGSTKIIRINRDNGMGSLAYQGLEALWILGAVYQVLRCNIILFITTLSVPWTAMIYGRRTSAKRRVVSLTFSLLLLLLLANPPSTACVTVGH